MATTDREILNLILKKLDKIESDILEMKYPPEEKIKPEFIERVKAAEGRIAEGKGKRYTVDQFKKKFSLG